jgi:hypothetical protein
MDARNRFHTAHTFLWVRLEHVAVLVVASALALLHFAELNLLHGLAAFAAIDLIGYLPGAIAQRRAGKGRISPLFHHLYNFTHSYLVAGCLVGLWALALGHFEWAMLAVPIHLSIDRGLFGNTYKPSSLPFEPQEA